MKKCKTCMFCVDVRYYEEDHSRECYRYPPIVQSREYQENDWASYPKIDRNDWCGEWKKKE